MKKKYFTGLFLLLSLYYSQSQTAAVCPNGDMESVNICFASGAIFSFWSDGCTDPYINPSNIANSGATSMLITNDNAGPAPMSAQSFALGASAIPGCITFSAKINLNAGDTVKFRAYINCNGGWIKTADWYFTDPNQVSIPFTQYQVPNNNAMMCILGMDSMKIELTGGKVMNGTTPTSFWIDDVVLGCTSGIDVPLANNDLVFFPNPARNELNFSIKNSGGKKTEEKISGIKIYSSSGEMIYFSGPVVSQQIDVTNVESGIYTVEVICESGILRRRIEIIK